MTKKLRNLLQEAVAAVQYQKRRKMKRKRKSKFTTKLLENLILKVEVIERKRMRDKKKNHQNRIRNSYKFFHIIQLGQHCHSKIKVSINSRRSGNFMLKHWDKDYHCYSHNQERPQLLISRIKLSLLGNSLQSKINMKK